MGRPRPDGGPSPGAEVQLLGSTTVAAFRYKIIGAGGMPPVRARGGGACRRLIGDDEGGEARRLGSARGRVPATTSRTRQSTNRILVTRAPFPRPAMSIVKEMVGGG
jgi:hypothetical protein